MNEEFATRLRRNQEFRIGIIVQVDPKNRKIVLKDQQGSDINISLHLLGLATTVMPKVGEQWMVIRKGIDWILDKRLDGDKQFRPITDLLPGDSQVSSSNNTPIVAPSYVIISGGKSYIYNLDIKEGFTIQDTTPIRGHISEVKEIEFPVLRAVSGTKQSFNHVELPITMDSVRLGDNIYVSPWGSPGSGTVWSARVIKDGVIGITLANTTTSGVGASKMKWSIDVWQHNT